MAFTFPNWASRLPVCVPLGHLHLLGNIKLFFCILLTPAGEGGGGRVEGGEEEFGQTHSKSECDIRENFDMNECPNIFVSTKLHE